MLRIAGWRIDQGFRCLSMRASASWISCQRFVGRAERRVACTLPGVLRVISRRPVGPPVLPQLFMNLSTSNRSISNPGLQGEGCAWNTHNGVKRCRLKAKPGPPDRVSAFVLSADSMAGGLTVILAQTRQLFDRQHDESDRLSGVEPYPWRP